MSRGVYPMQTRMTTMTRIAVWWWLTTETKHSSLPRDVSLLGALAARLPDVGW